MNKIRFNMLIREIELLTRLGTGNMCKNQNHFFSVYIEICVHLHGN